MNYCNSKSAGEMHIKIRIATLWSFLLPGMLIASTGCKEIHVTTTINRDGSSERVIVIETDSSSIGEMAFPVPDDASWSKAVALNEEDEEGNSYFHTYKKHFNRIDDLIEELTFSDMKGPQILSTMEFTRRNRWFTTYTTFRETYKEYLPYKTIPISEYLTPEEIARLRGSDEDKELEDRVQRWQTRNMFEDLFQKMLEGSTTLNDSELTPEILTAGKEEFFNVLIPLQRERDSDELTDVVLDVGREIYRTEVFERLRVPVEEFDRGLSEYTSFFDMATDESYRFTLVMPGVIYDSNSSEVQLNSATWEFSPMDFSYADYEMWVESRVTNRTAVWISVILLIFLVTLAVVLFLQRG